MKRTITFLICLLCLSVADAQVRHYTVKDGLQTNEVRQVIELPNGQVLVNCEGAFDLFDGHSFHELPCDRSRSYRLGHYKGYLHLWQGDSLLWLRDFYRLYLFDSRTLSFRYDIGKRLSENKELRQMSEEDGAYKTPDDRWQHLADSIGTGSSVAHVLTDWQGGLWLGTQSNGLFYVRPQRPMPQFVYTQKNVSGFLHNRMIFITQLQDGRLLLCNLAHCLGFFHPGRREFQPLNKTLPQLDNYRMLMGACPLANNKVVVYSQNGAFVLNTKSNSIEPFKPAEEIAQFSDNYNFFQLREEARHQFAENVHVDPCKISIGKEEEELAARLMKAIGKNMDNTDYTVDQLAADVALSRSILYRRMQNMLGITPNDFLRNVRLKHAAHLLGDTDLSVAQVALCVGFQSPRYFSRCFNKMFGVTPSEYREPK